MRRFQRQSVNRICSLMPTSTCHCLPMALTTRPSMGLLQAPQIGTPILSWHGRQYSSPFSSRASAVNSLLEIINHNRLLGPWDKLYNTYRPTIDFWLTSHWPAVAAVEVIRMVGVVLKDERLLINDGVALLTNVLPKTASLLTVMTRATQVAVKHTRSS